MPRERRFVAGPPDPRDRWRRRVLAAQGTYYLAIGLWPLVHFDSFADVVALQVIPFQAQALGAVLAVVGGTLLEAVRRGPPAPYPTALGIGVAGAIALVSLLWLPRQPAPSGLWFDAAIEVAIGFALVVLYPRSQSDRSAVQRKR
ncbi:MAG: hypothetical protein GWN32_00765 [Gemmatimonadetes bacterium]|nr:hypothetical protein [Gemmatimonadota bacterium]